MTHPLRHRLAAIVAAVLMATACGGSDDGPEPDDVTGEPPSEGPMDDGAAEPSDLEEEISQARASVDADAGDVEVVLAERVTWPDAALGCPEPDKMYTQALVDGYRIVLRVGGEEIAFHGAEGETPFRCDEPTDPAPAE